MVKPYSSRQGLGIDFLSERLARFVRLVARYNEGVEKLYELLQGRVER